MLQEPSNELAAAQAHEDGPTFHRWEDPIEKPWQRNR